MRAKSQIPRNDESQRNLVLPHQLTGESRQHDKQVVH